MKDRITIAIERSCQGFSVDRVIADPALNVAFQTECQNLGLNASPATLNRALINLRKSGGLRRIKSTPTSFPGEDQYRFAAEMTVRFMERRDGVSLDDIVCDPRLATEFDALAGAISPGFSSLEYRWAALNLRKASRLSPEILARVAPPVRVVSFPVSSLDLSQIPLEQGLYLFFTATNCLYVGEAENLFNRLKRHLDHSDNKGLAQWMWEEGSDRLFLELQILERTTTTRDRRALELELIRSRKPTFNVAR